MICPKCGAENANGSAFCIKCGSSLTTTNVDFTNSSVVSTQFQNVAPMTSEQVSPVNSTTQNVGSIVNNQTIPTQSVGVINNQAIPPQNVGVINNPMNVGVSQSSVTLNYIMYMAAVILRPIKCFQEEESKFNNPAISIILTLIVTIVMTLVKLITTVISVVRVASYSYKDGYTYTWEWANLKEINFIQVIGKNFLIYAGIVLGVALIFYLGSLIVKKQVSYVKFVGIMASSIIPYVAGVMILAPILGMIWSPLSLLLSGVASIYSLNIFYELINRELKLDGDAKVLFNVVCFSLITVIGYYLFVQIILGSASGGMDFSDIFK